MCAVAGIVARGRPSELDLRTMLEALVHRGPDGHGTFVEGAVAFGHRRLKILDLSDRARQPISDPDGLVVVTYNGEIYNYRELRAELAARGHRFRGTGDSEMLPAAYLEWGEAFVERLRGMFAFALYDRRDGRVLLVRDRLGIKPLYYAERADGLYFASEIKALLAVDRIGREAAVDLASVAAFFSRGYHDRGRTWFRGIRSLEPGTVATIDAAGAVALRTFWSLPMRNGEIGDDPAPRLRELLMLAADAHLQSDVPVGAHCSGGIDSSTLVALLAARVAGPLRTFSVAFAEGGVYDERPYIDRIVSRFGTTHHVTVPTAEDAWEALPRVVEALDEPIAGVGAIPQYLMNRDIRRAGVVVVNGGQGGDELFAGYRHHLLPYAIAELRRAHVLTGDASAALRTLGPRLALRLLLGNAAGLGFRLLHPELRRLARARRETLDLDEQLRRDVTGYLGALLQVEDRTSMAASIESRVPLLDDRIVAFAAAMHPSWKCRGGIPKRPLRDAARGVVPDAILDRTDKCGLPTPLGAWIRGPWRSRVRELLFDPLVIESGLFDARRIAWALRAHDSGRIDLARPLWHPIAAAVWLDRLRSLRREAAAAPRPSAGALGYAGAPDGAVAWPGP